MSILVVCPGCRKRFQVADQFAGKTGPCPTCKTQITIPSKEQEVKVHAPTEFASGGRSVTGQLVTKPISRKETRLNPSVAATVAGAALVVLAVAWVAGRMDAFDSLVARGLGLLLISPPLVLAGYTFLRNDELEPYQGQSLYIRTAICAVAYVTLWAMFGRVHGLLTTGELWMWFVVAPPFLVVGALAALACLDLDFGSGFLHYAFYVILTVMLRRAANLGWIWETTNT
jgi:hypothetical protein